MFHHRLEKLRERKKLTQDDVAKKIGVARPTYANYERGEREPNRETLAKLADLFDVSIDYLVTGNNSAVDKDIDPEWLELWEEVQAKGLEIDAKAFLRTTARDGVTKSQLRNILRVYEDIAKRRDDPEDE